MLAIWSFLYDLRCREPKLTKKVYIFGDNGFWPTSPRFVECNKRQVRSYKGQPVSENHCVSYEITSVGPRRLVKTQILEEKRNNTNVKGNLEGRKRYFDKYSTSYMVFSWGPKKSWTIFFKKKVSSWWKKTLAFFSQIIECDEPQETFLRVDKVC